MPTARRTIDQPDGGRLLGIPVFFPWRHLPAVTRG
jgi:hypothetical protein